MFHKRVVQQPLMQMGEHVLRDLDVVAQDLALGGPRAREQHPVEVADCQSPAADVELPGCHVGKLPGE